MYSSRLREMDGIRCFVWILIILQVTIAADRRDQNSRYTKISATLSCPMKLHKYPMDIQHCPMKFESYGYTMDTMSFSWLPRPVDTDPDIELPQFMLEDTILYNCSQIYTSGSFPCLEIQFVLRREVGFHVLQIYIPTMLIVALSWVAFWIDIEATLARVFVGLLTVMAITTQSTNANSSLPKVSYVKAIDIWFLLCLMFVFAGLLEFVVANMLNRKQGKSKQVQHLNI
ncbi:hypothetical protein LSH36_3g10049 [Paralvinella palmiformis]|uniref:Uncharacterized protein n=1 Tax=Paralvinella palmiformis TaxID=53620 RepID=A0AAD9KFM2_9ANNE|nr:hypothetical protein LSH36_3g10049 [Paralvinella palmiformis]